MRTIETASELDAPADAVWSRVRTLAGVNAELAPFVRMTAPRGMMERSLEEAPLGQPIFASYLLLFGFVPYDRHLLTLVRVEKGRGFVEESTSWTQRAWHHERAIEPIGEGRCRLVDRVRMDPRLPFVAPVLERVVTAIFLHRHRHLRAQFGSRAAPLP